jgi:Ni,Fe-hydrogenase maturation factor
MPTILFIYGWRLFFYSNEGLEPIHVHAEKGDMECKFWLLLDEVEIQEAFSYNMTPTAKKEIKKIIKARQDKSTKEIKNTLLKSH